ncbi:MAG: two-component regulator propeller domain-containing protein [Planctomycetota bacterium]|jgi:sugar lactone lactonase YvrE
MSKTVRLMVIGAGLMTMADPLPAAEPHWPALPLPKVACRGTEHCGRYVEDNPGWACHMPTLFAAAKNPDVAWHTPQQHVDWANDPLHSYVADGTGALTVIAHPGKWQEPLLATLKGLTGVEICHGGDFSRVHQGRWDRALRSRLKAGLGVLWGFASDDTHSSRKADRSWMAVRLDELTEHTLKAALRGGGFYVSTGPVITDIQVDGTKITVTLGQESDVRWLKAGQYCEPTRYGVAGAEVSIRAGKSRCVKLDKGVTTSAYALNAADRTADPARCPFVRCVVTADGRAAMTQPFVLGPGPALANPYPPRGKWFKGQTHNHTDALPGQTDKIRSYHADYAAKGHACAFETGYDYWVVPMQHYPPGRTPLVDRVDPLRLPRGASTRMTVFGAAFRDGAKLLVDGTEVPCRRVSPEQITFTAPDDLSVGPRTVTVRNPDGLQGTLQYAFTVQKPGAGNRGWTHFAPHNSRVGSRHTYAVAPDPAGGVWLATNHGLNCFDGGKWRLWRKGEDGLIANTIYDLAVDADGSAWFTCFRGMGVVKPDGALTQWRALDEKLPGKQINQILRAGGRTYVSVFNRPGLFVLADGRWKRVPIRIRGVRKVVVHGMAADRDGRIWMGSTVGLLCWDRGQGPAGWTRYHKGNSALPDDYVLRVAFDTEGSLWIATATRQDTQVGGLSRLAEGKWTTWSPGETPLPDRHVWSVCPDGQGNVWAATGRGAACLEADGTWKVLTPVNSALPSFMVTDVARDKAGNVWFATANGAARLDAAAVSAAGRPE